MVDILIRPAELRQISEQLKSGAKKIDTALQAIDNDILSLKGDQFLGNRANAVQAHYAPKREALLKAKEIVVHFAKDLQYAAVRFEQADQNTFGRLPSQQQQNEVVYASVFPWIMINPMPVDTPEYRMKLEMEEN